jgi:hypothetical protein
MASGLKTIIYPVKDLAGAKALYGNLLGVEPYVDQPYYVAFNVDGTDVGLDPNGHAKGMTGALPYWQVILHVVNHASYHRGQITTMLRQLGKSPVSTDLHTYYLSRG